MKFDFNKILELSKRYWVIIAFCVVMLIAVIAIPAFVSGQQEALQKDLDTRKATNDSIAQVLSQQRHQPVVSMTVDAAAPLLEQFPNDRLIAAGENAIKGVQLQSLKMKDDAVRINLHKLLVPGSLPDPTDTFRFQQIYMKQFQTEIPTLLGSATPPTDEEIGLRAQQETQRITAEQPHNASGDVWNKDVLQQNINMMLANLPERMRQDAAEHHKMYVAPTALSIHPALAPPAPGAPTLALDAEAIWLGQMGLWIQQDVAGAIAQLNAASTRVETSPVKQLVQIYVPSDRSLYVMPVPSAAGAAASPAAGPAAAPVTTDTDPFPKDYAASITGRVSNGTFDVVHFYVVLNVQVPDVERVIQTMERGRLLTVLQSEVVAVNSAAMQTQGYYFGKTPIVTLTLKCEELFMRDWTHTLMPPTIKAFLNVDQAPAAPTTPTASTN